MTERVKLLHTPQTAHQCFVAGILKSLLLVVKTVSERLHHRPKFCNRHIIPSHYTKDSSIMPQNQDFQPLATYSESTQQNAAWVAVTVTKTDSDGTKAQTLYIAPKKSK